MGDFISDSQNVSMAICVCVLKSEQKEEEFSPHVFHSTYSTQKPRNFYQNKEEKKRTHTKHTHSRSWLGLSYGLGTRKVCRICFLLKSQPFLGAATRLCAS